MQGTVNCVTERLEFHPFVTFLKTLVRRRSGDPFEALRRLIGTAKVRIIVAGPQMSGRTPPTDGRRAGSVGRTPRVSCSFHPSVEVPVVEIQFKQIKERHLPQRQDQPD